MEHRFSFITKPHRGWGKKIFTWNKRLHFILFKRATKTETNKNWKKEINTYVNDDLEVANAHSGYSASQSTSKLKFVNVGFWGGGKTEYPAKIFSEHRKEPTTNSTHIWRRSRDLNPGHMGGRRVLSPLRHLNPNPLPPLLERKGNLRVYRYFIWISKISFQSFAIFPSFWRCVLNVPLM